MKKSQILAALALAFALGVVAPVATTSAYMYQYDRNGAEEEIKASQLIDDLNDEITEARNHKSQAEYDDYKALIDLLDGDEAVAIDIPASALSVGRYVGTVSLNDIKDARKDDVLAAFPASYDTSTLAKESFETVMSQASRQLSSLYDKVGATSAEYDTLKKAYDDAKAYVMYTEEATIAAIQSALANDFDYKGNANYMTTTFTEKDDNGDLKSVDFAGAVAYAKKQAGDFNYYNNLIAAVKQAQAILKSKATGGDKYTVAQGQAALTALRNAIAGTTTNPDNSGTGEGTNNGEGDDKKDPNAPDTGLLADAEANASTTVAMVAGIATALTAAGAGVVAYRNARRSTRK